MPTQDPERKRQLLRLWLKMAVESGHLSTLYPQYSPHKSQTLQPTDCYAGKLIVELKDPDNSSRPLSDILHDAQRFRKWIERCSRIPTTCPVCGSDRVKRILWAWVCCGPKETGEFEAGRVILAGRRRGTTRHGLGAADGAHETVVAPKWACLKCEPMWAEVHRVALAGKVLELEKEKAAKAQDFETAALWSSRQHKLEDEIFELVKGLLGGQHSSSGDL